MPLEVPDVLGYLCALTFQSTASAPAPQRADVPEHSDRSNAQPVDLPEHRERSCPSSR